MKKKSIITVLLVLVCMGAYAQDFRLEQQTVQAKDLATLLKGMGCEAHVYDLTPLADKTYEIRVKVREYVGGKLVQEEVRFYDTNRMMITEFPKEDQEEWQAEGHPVTEPVSLSTRLFIDFLPVQNDSVQRLFIGTDKGGERRDALILRAQQDPKTGTIVRRYACRPFKPVPFTTDKFIPLLFHNAFWYDPKAEFFRSCGSIEIDPEMTDDIIANSPFFYVIGVEFKEVFAVETRDS